VHRGCSIETRGGLGQGWPMPNSWEKGEGEEEEFRYVRITKLHSEIYVL